MQEQQLAKREIADDVGQEKQRRVGFLWLKMPGIENLEQFGNHYRSYPLVLLPLFFIGYDDYLAGVFVIIKLHEVFDGFADDKGFIAGWHHDGEKWQADSAPFCDKPQILKRNVNFFCPKLRVCVLPPAKKANEQDERIQVGQKSQNVYDREHRLLLYTKL